MDVKQISYFVEIADYGSYSAAAKALAISQPTLSVAIRKLEQEFGLSLFYYYDKKVNLTNEGKIFYNYARDFLAAYKHMMESSWRISQEIVGEVTIVAAPGFSRLYLGDLLADYRERYPGVVIHVTDRGGTSGLELIDSQDADFAMKTLPVDTNAYDVIPLVNQKLWLGVHVNHHLASRQTVSFGELKDETFLSLNDNYSLHQQFMKNCEEAGFTPNIAVTSSDYDFLASLVSRNCGVFLMGRAMWMTVNLSKIKLLEVTDANMVWNLCLVSKKGRVMSNAALALAALTREYFADGRSVDEFMQRLDKGQKNS